MKLSKRLLSMMLVVVFCLTSFAVVPVSAASAAFTDLTEEHYAYDAVNVLSKLGVINGYEENGSFNFKPDNNVTRAEFAAMLLRTRGMGSVGSMSLENPPFPDVTTPDVSWAIGNIRTARELGIINGYDDGTFKPNNNVSYEEAVTMIVRALGYGEMGTDGAFWYSKYIMTATSLGFMEGAGGAIATPATRATIASMLYNCLEVNLAEDNKITDKTILENDLKLTKMVGYISSNPTISLSKPDANLRADEVEITVNGVASTYKVDDASKYNDMLGAQIEFYYQNDFNSGLKTLLLATVKNSTTIKIDASLIQNASASGISYFKNEDAQRETTVSVSASSVVVYNGKLYGSAADSTSTFATYYGAKGMPEIGRVELLDRDGDNVYDVVFVYDYDVYFVSSVTPSDYKIVDNDLRKGMSDSDRQITLNYKSEDINFYTADGGKTDFSAIKKGSVIFVAESNHPGGAKDVIVCNDTVSGKISGTSSSKGYTINGKNYKESTLAPWKNVITGATPSLTSAPAMGDSAKFYLDMEGNIIWYDKTETASNQQYGYVTGARVDTDNFESSARVNIVTKSNTSGTPYTITTKSKLNDAVVGDINDFVDLLDAASQESTDPTTKDGDFKQLVKFSTTKGTEIEEIITYESQAAGKDIVADKLYRHSGIDETVNCSYSSSNKEMTQSGTKIYLGNATIIAAPGYTGSAGKYKFMSAGSIVNGNYKIEVFGVTKTNSAKVVVIHDAEVTVAGVNGNSPAVVIAEIRQESIGGESRYVIDGYEGKDRKEWTLSNTDSATVSTAPTLQKGDMIRVGTDFDNYYTVKADDIIFSMAAGHRDVAITKAPNANTYPKREDVNGNVACRFVWGSAYQYDGDSGSRFIVSTDILGAGDTPTGTFDMEKTNFSNAQIFKFKASDTELIHDITADGYENALAGLTYSDSTSAPSEIFIYMTGTGKSVKTMIIVER